MNSERVLVGVGLVGLIVAVVLGALIAGRGSEVPPVRTVCDEVTNPDVEVAPGVTAGEYCAQIDFHQALGLLSADGFYPRFPHTAFASGSPRYLRWDTDGCSAPVIGEGPYDFSHPCHRHDFNWRNLKDLDRDGAPVWNARTKARADVGFLADMFSECTLLTPLAQIGCETTARIYYTVVHLNPSGLGVLETFE
jgi:hypothetical protein